LDLAQRKARIRKPAVDASAVPQVPVLVDMGRKVSVAIKKSSPDEILYTLSDGSKLKLKPMIVSIERSLEKFNPQGEPLYQVNVGLFVHTDVPKKLKRKVKPQ
jgi:hypothetical protein